MVNTDQIKDIQSRIEDLHKFLGIEKKKIEIANDEEKTAAPEFWEKPKEAEVFLKQLRSKKKWVESYEEIKTQFEDLQVLIEFAKEDPDSEKELDETFPQLVEKNQLFSYDLPGYWMDVGQPKDFLSGTSLYLTSLSKRNPEKLCHEKFVYDGNVLVDPSAKIHPSALIGPNVTIGPNVIIGEGVRIQRSVLLSNSEVRDHAWVKSTIVGWNSRIGKWARTEGCTVLGDDVEVKNEIYVNGAKVLPHKSISSNVEHEAIIM